jgi:hypothetical protein
MPKRNKPRKRPPKALDIHLAKRGRGRPVKMAASEVRGRAYNYRLIFSQIWEKVGERLLQAQTPEAVVQAFDETAYRGEFEPLASLFLRVLREPDFPKRDSEAQANFLAESLAARGTLAPRTSRDICERERAKERARSPYKIIRHEYYIECECGYKGPALDNACRKCGAEIPRSLDTIMGLGFR